MRLSLFILLSALSFNAVAFDETYYVSGSNDESEPVEGKVFVTFGDSNVNGELTGDDGILHSFQGELRDGRIFGRTESGEVVELKID